MHVAAVLGMLLVMKAQENLPESPGVLWTPWAGSLHLRSAGDAPREGAGWWACCSSPADLEH